MHLLIIQKRNEEMMFIASLFGRLEKCKVYIKGLIKCDTVLQWHIAHQLRMCILIERYVHLMKEQAILLNKKGVIE